MSNEQAAERFAKSAATYCEVIESRARWPRAAFLRRVQEVLPSLYAEVLVLPDVEPADDQERYPVLTIEDRASIFNSVEELLGSHSLYWKVYDPIGVEPEEPLSGNLADDLIGIYRDLQDSLLGWRHGEPGERQNALWEWRFAFQTHWGAHAVDAMRAIHWLLYEHHIEVMERDGDAPSDRSAGA